MIAKKTYEDTIEKLEAMMGKTRSALHEKLEKEGDKNEENSCVLRRKLV